jgi:uncharacterized delta-60 repeat protein
MLTVNGTLDTSFDNDGLKQLMGGTYGTSLNAVAIDKNNKIVVGGTSYESTDSNLFMARLNLDGSLDTDSDGDAALFFTSSGIATFDLGLDETIESIATLPDGSVIGVGLKGSWGFIVKILENGSLDTAGFAASKGYLQLDLDPSVSNNSDLLTRVKIKNDGKIVAAGYSIDAQPISIVIQLNSNGTVDGTFDSDGIAAHDFGSGVSQVFALDLDASQRIVIAGTNSNATDNDIYVARLTATGAKDTKFNSTGAKLFDYGGIETATVLKVRSDGTLLIGGGDDLNLFPTPFFFLQKLNLVEP